jgi:hypothetical protein
VPTSSGNTGSALAAYRARAGIRLDVALVETTPAGKVFQMLAHGARLYRVRGFGLDAEITRRTFERIVEIGRSPGSSLEIRGYRYSPVGMSGVETIAHVGFRDRPGCPGGTAIPHYWPTPPQWSATIGATTGSRKGRKPAPGPRLSSCRGRLTMSSWLVHAGLLPLGSEAGPAWCQPHSGICIMTTVKPRPRKKWVEST